MKHIIANIEDFEVFIYSKKPHSDTIHLNFPFIDNETNLQYSEEINKYRNACGCDMGGRFLVLSIILCITLSIFKISFFDTQLIKQIIISVLIIFTSSVIGKIIGIFYSKYKIKFTIRSIEKTVQQSLPKNASKASHIRES